jgi:integrase
LAHAGSGRDVPGPLAPGEEELQGVAREAAQGHALVGWRAEGPRRSAGEAGEHIVPALDGTYRPLRIRVLKAFYGWLRNVRHAIEDHEDPTRRLSAPQSTPKQWSTSRVIPEADHAAVLRAIGPRWADLIVLLHDVGWHVSELLRFARDGVIEKHESGDTVLVFRHKSGRPHLARVEPHLVPVARRVRERRGFSESRLYRAIQVACKKTGVGPYGPGRYGHTNATRMVNEGASAAEVSARLGHQSTQTTRRLCATHAAAPVPGAKVPRPGRAAVEMALQWTANERSVREGPLLSLSTAGK